MGLKMPGVLPIMQISFEGGKPHPGMKVLARVVVVVLLDRRPSHPAGLRDAGQLEALPA